MPKKIILLTIGLAFGLTACFANSASNINRSRLPGVENNLSIGEYDPSDTYTTDGGYTCPAEPNIRYHDEIISGPDFVACTHPELPAGLRIDSGSFEKLSGNESEQICAFPLSYNPSSGEYFAYTNNHGFPMYVCATNHAQGGAFFPLGEAQATGIYYNAIAIVRSQEATAMQIWLMTANNSYIPNEYSVGRVR